MLRLYRDWLFLNQEWRFVMPDRRGRKSDILAVHSTTGQLGIIEAKDDRAKRPEAEDQLETYATAFASDAPELAELFTAQLNVLAKLYGSPAAEQLQVSTRQAQRFFAYPGGLFATKLKVVRS